MRKEEVILLYGYNFWANDRILDRAAELTDHQYLDPAGLDHGSLHATLVHILTAEWLWRSRCQGDSPTRLLSASDFPTLESLRQRWALEKGAMLEFLDGLADTDLDRRVDYRTTGGVPYSETLWQLLVHMVNHGTQHRSEAAGLLTRFSRSPGDLDLIDFLRESE